MSGKGRGTKRGMNTVCNMADRKRAQDANKGVKLPPQSITLSYTPRISNINQQIAQVNALLACRVAIASGMDVYTFQLMLEYFTTCYWYQIPPPDRTVRPNPNNIKLGNGFHALNRVLRRDDISPDHPCKLPLGPNTLAFRSVHADLYKGIIYYLVRNLHMHPEDEPHVSVDCRRYLSGRGIDWHSDYNRKIGRNAYSMRLVVGIGASREVSLRVDEYDLVNPRPSGHGTTIKKLGYSFQTGDCGSAYLMPPDISGKDPLCYTNEDKTKIARALHKVGIVERDGDGAIMVIDFILRTEKGVLFALENSRDKLFSLIYPKVGGNLKTEE